MTDSERSSKQVQRLKAVQPRAGKNFKVKYLPKSTHPPREPIIRPPWNHGVWIKPKSNRYERSTSCRTHDVEVPCPDYTCVKATRYKCIGNEVVPSEDVVLMRRNYKPAVWCDPVRRFKQVRHCGEYCCGSYREFEEKVPSNFQVAYINENAPRERVQYQGSSRAACPLYIPVKRQQESNTNPESTRVFYESTKVTKIS